MSGRTCLICGKTMVRFDNPERWLCPTSEGEHNRIKAAAERSRKSIKTNRGKQKPRSQRNLPKRRKK